MYDELVESGRKYIILTERVNIPDMKAIDGTLGNFQVTCNSRGGGNEKIIITSERQCYYPPCRKDPTRIETCRYTDERGEIKIQKLRDFDDIEQKYLIHDPHGIRALKVKELGEESKARYLPITR